MTIKEFAQLCSCNMQTLRYYDKIDLLKPIQVDRKSGYRHYAPAQAVDFVKIKNLQAADFTIDEIKKLLALSDQQVYEAFDSKIAQQEQKLARIREIQRSYLAEKNSMEQIIYSMTDYLLSQCSHPEVLTEFGLTVSDAPAILAHLKDYMNSNIPREELSLTVNGEVIQGQEAILNRIHSFTKDNIADTIHLNTGLGHEMEVSADTDPDFSNWDIVWERRGWEHVYDFIDAIPRLKPDDPYCLRVEKKDGTIYDEDLSYSLFLVGAVLHKQQLVNAMVSCCVTVAAGRESCFRLLKHPSI